MWGFIDNKVTLVEINHSYTDFLRQNIDHRIPEEHMGNGNRSRAFIGVLINNGNHKYVIPLSSPKQKHLHMHNSIDFHKINNGFYGAINFNNMFPIIDSPSIYRVIDTSLNPAMSQDETQYRNLLRNQLSWLNIADNRKMVLSKAEHLYDAYINETLNDRVKQRCCNFITLEKHYQEYNQ